MQDEKSLYSAAPGWGDEAYNLIGKNDSKSVARAKTLDSALTRVASLVSQDQAKIYTVANSGWITSPRTGEVSDAVSAASSAVDNTEFIMSIGVGASDEGQYSAYNSMAHSYASAASQEASIANSYATSVYAVESAKEAAGVGISAVESTTSSIVSATNSYVKYASLAASQPINQSTNSKTGIRFDKTWHRYWRNVTTIKTFYLKNAQGQLIGTLPIGTKVDIYSDANGVYVTKPNKKTVLGNVFVDGTIQFDLTDAVVGGNTKYSVNSDKFNLYRSIKNGVKTNLVKYAKTWPTDHRSPKSITLGTTVFKQVSIPKNKSNIQARYKTKQGDVYEIDNFERLFKNGKQMSSGYNVYGAGITGGDLTYAPVVIGQQVYLKVKVQVFDKTVTGYVNVNQFSQITVMNENFYGGNYKG